MDEALEEYLERLGATSPVFVGVKRALAAYQELGVVWEDVFLAETVDDAGQRVWGSLWLFTDHHVCEARDVTTAQNYDVATIDRYSYARFELKDFDFKNATPESRMLLKFYFSATHNGEIRASGRNCERLAQIARKRLMPDLSGVRTPSTVPAVDG